MKKFGSLNLYSGRPTLIAEAGVNHGCKMKQALNDSHNIDLVFLNLNSTYYFSILIFYIHSNRFSIEFNYITYQYLKWNKIKTLKRGYLNPKKK